MDVRHLHALTAALAALLGFGSTEAGARERPVGGGLRLPVPSNSNLFSWEHGHGFKRGFPIFIVQRQPVIIEREVVVVREVAARPAPPPTPSPEGEGKRKPYVVGRSYASLPGGCMKMIEGGASYYWCSGGEWYRLVGKQYRAVAKP